MPTYAPAHHRLLTRAQTDKFISALTSAKDAGDTEKAVEQAINDLLVAGLTKAHPDATLAHDYRHNTDGYICLLYTSPSPRD